MPVDGGSRVVTQRGGPVGSNIADDNSFLGHEVGAWRGDELNRTLTPQDKDTRPVDLHPVDPRPGDLRPGDTRPVDLRPGDTRPVDLRPGDLRPGDLRPGDTRPVDLRPVDLRPVDLRPGDTRPVDLRPGDMQQDLSFRLAASELSFTAADDVFRGRDAQGYYGSSRQQSFADMRPSDGRDQNQASAGRLLNGSAGRYPAMYDTGPGASPRFRHCNAIELM